MHTEFSLHLRCLDPELEVDFELPPGTFARIGSSEAAEICIPLPGIHEFSCRLRRAADGDIFLGDAEGLAESPILLPTTISLPPIQIVLMAPVPKSQATTSRPLPPPPPPQAKSPTAPPARPQAPALLSQTKAPAVPPAPTPAPFSLPTRNQAPPPPPPPLPPPARKLPVKPNGQEKQYILLAAGAMMFLGICIIAAAIILRGKPQQDVVEKPSTSPAAETPNTTAPIAQPLAAAPSSPPASIPVEDAPAHSTPPPVPSAPDLEQLAEKVEPTVFTIDVMDSQGEIIGTGTGFTINPDGLLVTNAHVIKNGYSFKARSSSGKIHTISKVINSDAYADLAIVQVISLTPLPFLELGDSELLKTGAPISVFGAAGGLSGTLSEGVVSAKRSDSSLGESLPNGGHLIQITAPISSGSSGSPVLDREGKVVAVVSSQFIGKTLQNLNFAIPASAVITLRNKPAGTLPHIPSAPAEETPLKPQVEKDAEADPLAVSATILIDRRSYAEALPLASRLVDRHPRSSHALRILGTVQFFLDNYAEAERSMEKAIAIDPANLYSYLVCGVCECTLGKYFEARSKLKKAVELDPSYTATYNPLAGAQLGCGDVRGAISTIESLRTLDPSAAAQYLRELAGLSSHSEAQLTLLSHFGERPASYPSSSTPPRAPSYQPKEKRFLTDEDMKLVLAKLITTFLQNQEKADPTAELMNYDEVIDPYYERKEPLTRSEVLRHLQNIRTEWPSRSLKLMEVTSFRRFEDGVVVVTYKVLYRFSNRTKVRQGEMRQSICITVEPSGKWVVSGVLTQQ